MIARLTRRLLLAVPTLLVVSMIMFALLWLAPNPLGQLTEAAGYDAADIQRLTEQYGWNEPAHTQYLDWATHFATGDWGESLRTHRPAREMIAERLGLSMTLASLAMLLALLVAVPLGIVAAIRRGSRIDMLTSALSIGMMALPGFLLAVLLQLVAVKLRDTTGHTILYTGGAMRGDGMVEAIQRYTLPVVTMAAVMVAGWVRFQRGELIGVLESDYVRAAWAKGLRSRAVLLRHALRNTALPMLTILAMDFGHIVGGAVVVETVFGIPGMGRLLIDSVQARDLVVALDIVMLTAFAMVVANAVADTLYGVIDPRTRDAT
jgi:peptide/nickel transport system permease protein